MTNQNSNSTELRPKILNTMFEVWTDEYDVTHYQYAVGGGPNETWVDVPEDWAEAVANDLVDLIRNEVESVLVEGMDTNQYPTTVDTKWIEEHPHEASSLSYSNGWNNYLKAIQSNIAKRYG